MKQGIIYFTSLILSIIISACEPDFNTDFEPPEPDKKLTDLFPVEIKGLEKRITMANMDLPMGGYSAYFGENKVVISVIKAPSNEADDEYFEFAILPNFDKMKINSWEKINGKWSLNGTDHDGRIWVGWVNNN